MKTPPGYKCDGNGCNALRTETNHWVLVFRSGGAFVAMPWSDDSSEREDVFHLCGDTCALKFFADWLSKIRVAPSAEPSIDLGGDQGRSLRPDHPDLEPSLGRPGVETTKGLPV